MKNATTTVKPPKTGYCALCDYEDVRKRFNQSGVRADGSPVLFCKDEAGCDARRAS